MKRKGKPRFGRLVFFLPVAVVLGLFVYGYFQTLAISSGVLIVEARSSYGQSSHFITATATVSGKSEKTPFNLTLRPGSYTVIYGALQWYNTPQPREVSVNGGRTAYAVGIYQPIALVVGVNQGGFNSTQVTAKGGITPVVWVDTSSQSIQVKGNDFNVVLSPGQNYTRVFTTAGRITVNLLGTNAVMTVNVA